MRQAFRRPGMRRSHSEFLALASRHCVGWKTRCPWILIAPRESELAQAHGVSLKVLSAARDVNHTLADRLVDKIATALNSVESALYLPSVEP